MSPAAAKPSTKGSKNEMQTMSIKQSIARIAAFTFAALTFLDWWQNTLAVQYAGPMIWNLIMAGLFWLAAAASLLEAARLAREAQKRVAHLFPLR